MREMPMDRLREETFKWDRGGRCRRSENDFQKQVRNESSFEGKLAKEKSQMGESTTKEENKQ